VLEYQQLTSFSKIHKTGFFLPKKEIFSAKRLDKKGGPDRVRG